MRSTPKLQDGKFGIRVLSSEGTGVPFERRDSVGISQGEVFVVFFHPNAVVDEKIVFVSSWVSLRAYPAY